MCPLLKTKGVTKKDIFNSNKKISISSSTYFKVYALNHALLISSIYYEAKGNKLLLWKQRKNHNVKKKKGIKQAVKFDEQGEWRKSLWLYALGSESYSTTDR